ncbi:DUF2087 domain-containing protein [Evansella sp. AB-P1]|uniref:DUF2087 domain-containing protein n=1 Tax=Evansella sp. AB-P1 TaxID=3037653 RepID=UPI00241F941E|nr:DUF2087 domain-containing protein [Evansella sp. AB-P1]MDG5788397.1 DUF2087 domain-containing protein [Evansella sp. AB-P1]
MSDDELFWNASIEELTNGYIYLEEKEEYICLICNERFESGVIYEIESRLLEAKKAIQLHITDSHDSMFHNLISMDKKYTGLSENQKELLQYFYKGLSDKEIVKEQMGGSTSTIRNHRFKFKEKEKQAKIFLSLMNIVKNSKEKSLDELVPFHKGATMVDERYATTIEEKEKVLATYFEEGLNGPLHIFPSKEKRKIIVLQHILTRFESNKMYSEKEVNTILKSIYSDYATIRRYFIEYGFMDRSKDCSTYWIKN